MKYPLNIFLHNIVSCYRQICTHKVAKIQLLGKKFIILNFSEYKVLKMKFWHGKRLKIKDSTDEISSKYIFTQYSIMISTNFYS